MSTIVVIEDDLAMRTLICEWLSAEGYRVRGVVAPGAGADVELVVVNVADMRSGGARTLREVQACYPRSTLIGISTQLGRSLPGDSALARSLHVSRLIAKPFARDELLGAVVETIGVAD